MGIIQGNTLTNRIYTNSSKVISKEYEIIDGKWLNEKGEEITLSQEDTNVKIAITTSNVPDNILIKAHVKESIEFGLDKPMKTFSGKIKANQVVISVVMDREDLLKYSDVAKLYFEVELSCKGELVTKEFPTLNDKYLQVIEPEEKITIIVEIPHSKETGMGAKGLSGHTAMAIGKRFFDYGPDYDHQKIKIFNEKQYQADLNQDGDMEDKLKIADIKASYYFAPGRPWWGETIGNALKKSAGEVTLSEALELINLSWKVTNIYGAVSIIEFYVKKSEANKMLEWWENRYKHLKIYSVKPWTGEQCTTAVKQALDYAGIDDIDWYTLTPDGILKDLDTEMKSTSYQNKDKKAKVTPIKEEARDWKP